MQNIKIIRTQNNIIYAFFFKGGSLYCSTLNISSNSQPEEILNNIYPEFSVWCSNEDIYAIGVNEESILLSRYSNGSWTSRTIDGGIAPNCSKLSFFVHNSSIHFLYSLKNENGQESLHVRSMLNGKWLPDTIISEIMPFHFTSYLTGRENDSAIKIFYRLSDKTIKYCTLNTDAGSISQSINLLATNMPCIDISTLTDNYGGHLLYLAQGMFSTQLIYKGRTGDSLGKAHIIWEGQNAQGCSLFSFNNRVYAVLYTKKDCYLMVLDERTSEFSRPRSLGTTMTSNMLKAEYTNFYSNSLNADELYIVSDNFEFPVAAELCSDFYPEISTLRPAESETVSPPIPMLQPHPETENYINQISDMSEQISQLSKMLSERNEELASLSARWKMKYEQLQKEYHELKNQIASQSVPSLYASGSDIVFVQSREI